MAQQCYVCFEAGEDLLEGVCACKELVVHTRCLLEWIEKTQRPDCPVCRARYEGVVLVPAKPRRGGLQTACLAACVTAAFAGLGALTHRYVTQRPGCAPCAVTAGFFGGFQLVLYAIVLVRVTSSPPRPAPRVDAEALRDRNMRV